MGGERNIVRLHHGRDTTELGKTAAMHDVRFQDVDACIVQEALYIPAAVEALAERDGRAGELREEGLFDEEGAVRFDWFGELFGHGLMQSAVEVNLSIHAQRLHDLQPLNGASKHTGAIEPFKVLGGVHFHTAEALRIACFGGVLDIVGTVAADPGVNCYFSTDSAAEELADGEVEAARFEVPEGDVKCRKWQT